MSAIREDKRPMVVNADWLNPKQKGLYCMSTYKLSSAAAIMQRMQQQREEVEALKELFNSLMPEFIPYDRQFRIWLQRYEVDVIAASIERTAEWVNQMQQKVEELEAEGRGVPAALRKAKLDIVKYASGTMKGKAAEPNKESTASTTSAECPTIEGMTRSWHER
jgi:hypothetical protein